MNEYYKKRPIKNGNFASDYLSEDFQLSQYNLALILGKIEPTINFEKDKMKVEIFER